MLGLPGKMARKRCSFATCSIFEPGSVMATKWLPAFSCPTASTVFAQKNWKKMLGSSVLPLLLETMNSVCAGSTRLLKDETWTGSVESSTSSSGFPFTGP